jgi:hypothetical protein
MYEDDRIVETTISVLCKNCSYERPPRRATHRLLEEVQTYLTTDVNYLVCAECGHTPLRVRIISKVVEVPRSSRHAPP